MKTLLMSAAVAALCGIAVSMPAIADTKAVETKAAAPADMKMTDAQCTTLWSSAMGTATGDLAMDKAQPYVKDFKKADVNGDSKLSASEWKDACSKGWVMSDAGGAATTPARPVNTPDGATSDRTPGGATERTPGAGSTGAAGTGAAQTPAGTSDRTPKN